MNGLHIRPSETIKYLGIYLDSNLTGKSQSNEVIKLKKYGMLSKARHYVPLTELLSIYYGTFSTHMTYSYQVWGQQNSTVTIAICRLQYIAIRNISFSGFNYNADPI